MCQETHSLLLSFPPGIPSHFLAGQDEQNSTQYPMYKGVKEQHRTGQKNSQDGIT